MTGSTGLLGNNLVRLLAGRGVRVKALARSSEKAAKQFAGIPVEVVDGDMLEVARFAPALAGCDALFHTAAHFRDSYKGGKHSDSLHAINVEGTGQLLEAAYAAGIRRAVHTSSVAVLNGPPGQLINETMERREADADDYYRSKILADRKVRARLATIVLGVYRLDNVRVIEVPASALAVVDGKATLRGETAEALNASPRR